MGLFSKMGRVSLDSGKKIQNNQRRIKTLSKVAANLGTRYRLFLPVVADNDGAGNLVNPSIASCLVAGRTCDYDCLGTSFFTYTEKDCEIDDAGKVKKDTTNLQALARVADALYNASMNEQLILAEEDWEKRKNSGEAVTDAMLEQKKQLIVDLYTGKVEERRNAEIKMRKGNNSFRAPQRLIGRIGVEQGLLGVLVELDSDNKPKLETVQAVSIPALSNQRRDLLSDFVKQPNTIYPDKFIEVEYNLIGADIDEAKRNAKFGKVEIGSQSSAFSQCDDNTKKELLEDIKSKLVYNDDVIQSNILRYDTTSNTAETLESKIKAYLKDKRLTMAHLDVNTDVAKWAAKDMKELGFYTGFKNDFSGEDLSASIESLITKGTTEEAPKDDTAPTASASEDIIKQANLADDDFGTV